jgi:hypothetical protein
VGKFSLQSYDNEALSNESFLKRNSDEALSDDSL